MSAELLLAPLAPRQAQKFVAALGELRRRPNTWMTLDELDEAVCAGPMMRTFPDAWLEAWYAHLRSRNTQFRLRVCLAMKEEPGESAVSASTEPPSVATVADTESGVGPPAHGLLRAMRPFMVGGGRRVVSAKFTVAHFATADAVVSAVNASMSAETGRVGVSTARDVMLDEVAVAAMQDAVDRDLVWCVPAYAQGAPKSRPTRRRAAGDEDGDADADVAVAGAHGQLEDVALAGVDFATWLASSPVAISHSRTVAGVKMDDAALPAVLRTLDGPVSATVRLRAPDPGTVYCVSFPIECKGVAPVAVTPLQVELSAAAPSAAVEIEAVRPGKACVRVIVRAKGSNQRPTKAGDRVWSGLRPLAVVEPYQIQADRKRPVVLYARGNDGDNVLTEYGVDVLGDASVRLVSPAPALTAAVLRLSQPEASELSRASAGMLVSIEKKLRKENGEERDSVRPDAKKVATLREAFDQHQRNRHMLAYGLDTRRPYEARPDEGTTVLVPLAHNRRKRAR